MMRFYVLFNSISDNQDDGRLVVTSCNAMEPTPFTLKRFPPPAGIETGAARSVNH